MAECILDPIIEEELWEIWDYIAKDNPDAATEVRKAAQETFKTLAENPGLGKPKSLRGIRAFMFGQSSVSIATWFTIGRSREKSK